MVAYAIWRIAAKHMVVDSRHTTAHARGQLVQQSISASGQLDHSLLVAVHHQTLFDRLDLGQAGLGKLTSLDPESDMLLAHFFLPAFISSGERG